MGARRIVLRPLTEGESSTLEQRLREKRLPAKIYERYRIIDLVRDGMTSAAASRAVGCSDGKAEHWVHRFNDSGFTSFEKQPNHPGRPKASWKGCGVPAVIATRHDCAVLAGGPFLGYAGGPLP